jgi:3-phytase
MRLPSTFTLPNGTAWTPCGEPGEGPQVEGHGGDAAYLAQEDVVLWRVSLDRGAFGGRPRSVERTREFGVPAVFDPVTEECMTAGADPGFGGRIAADVEGLTIYPTWRTSVTLLVSSQGDNTFYTYDRRTNRPLGHFAVVDGPRADGCQECDGAATTVDTVAGLLRQTARRAGWAEHPDRPDTNFKFLDAGLPSPALTHCEAGAARLLHRCKAAVSR